MRIANLCEEEMGEVASIIKACSCQDCAKYVCNACRCHSSCLEFCDIEFETTEIDLSDDDSQYDIEVIGCCGARKQ